MTAAPPLLFDRALYRRHVARAKPGFAAHRALFDDIAEQLDERVHDVLRPFKCAVDLSPFPFLRPPCEGASVTASPDIPVDEELLPYLPQSFDLAVSNLGLHWVNDVPGALAQIRASLKPDGLFLASLIGGGSLKELRSCLIEAEATLCGGASPRFSPMIDLADAGALLLRTGFKLPVADSETVTLLYPDMFALMRDLRGMGQTNAHPHRQRTPTRRAVFSEAAKLYQERFADQNGHIPATFEILYLHGWS